MRQEKSKSDEALKILNAYFPCIYTKFDLVKTLFSGITIGIILGIFLWSAIASASELKHSFRSPAFNGQGYSSHVLTIENLTFERKQSIKSKQEAAAREAEREAENTNINKFLKNFESRVYAELSKQLSEKLFGENPQTSGTITILGNKIEYDTIGDTIKMTVTDANGTVTTVEIPTSGFGF